MPTFIKLVLFGAFFYRVAWPKLSQSDFVKEIVESFNEAE
jgi:hypothetical protein